MQTIQLASMEISSPWMELTPAPNCYGPFIALGLDLAKRGKHWGVTKAVEGDPMDLEINPFSGLLNAELLGSEDKDSLYDYLAGNGIIAIDGEDLETRTTRYNNFASILGLRIVDGNKWDSP